MRRNLSPTYYIERSNRKESKGSSSNRLKRYMVEIKMSWKHELRRHSYDPILSALRRI
jgi:hypothetical protein